MGLDFSESGFSDRMNVEPDVMKFALVEEVSAIEQERGFFHAVE